MNVLHFRLRKKSQIHLRKRPNQKVERVPSRVVHQRAPAMRVTTCSRWVFFSHDQQLVCFVFRFIALSLNKTKSLNKDVFIKDRKDEVRQRPGL